MLSKKDDKRSALLQAALELFAEHGFNGSPTALIAKRAGVATGTLFFHFKSKEELIHELFREVRAKIDRKILENFQVDTPMREQFLQTFTRLLRYFLENPQEFKLVEQYHFSPFREREYCATGEDQTNQTLRTFLLQARERQLIKDAPLLMLEVVAFGPITALAKEYANRGTPIDEEMIRLTVEACWDGLKR